MMQDIMTWRSHALAMGLGIIISMTAHSQSSPPTTAQPATKLPDTFRTIQAAGDSAKKAEDELPMSYRYGARADFSQPSLSPSGTRMALVARMDNSVTSLVVVDISGNAPKVVSRLEVPYMKGVRQYGWASDNQLVAWLDIDTSYSSDDDPAPSQYIAQLDLTTGKVTERVQPIMMSSDVAAATPVSTELLRAPFREPGHALIHECKRLGGVKYQQRGEEVNFTFATSNSLQSSSIVCQVMDWNMKTNRASRIARPFYAQPVRFLASKDGSTLFAEGRKVGGKTAWGTLTPASNRWQTTVVATVSEQQDIWDNGELDFPEQWRSIHAILKNRIDPAGQVITTNVSAQPLGIQFTSPEIRFVSLDAQLAVVETAVRRALDGTKAWQRSTLKWLSATDNKEVVLFQAESLTHPGAYFIWRQRDNVVMRVTDLRSLDKITLAKSYLEPGWLPGYVPVAVTPPSRKIPKGIVLMPQVMDDEVAAEALRTVDMTADWLAFNGLVVARVPVALPAALPAAQQGAAWRNAVAMRLSRVARELRTEFKVDGEAPVCVLGTDLNGYAALASAAFGGPRCVIAMNVKLDPKLFASPYRMITSTEKIWYVTASNVELRSWRSLYGADLDAGTPGNWRYPQDSDIFVGYHMFDDHRTDSTSLGGLSAAVTRTGGRFTLYNTYKQSGHADAWLGNYHDELISFILPPVKKVGRVYVEDIQTEDSKTSR